MCPTASRTGGAPEIPEGVRRSSRFVPSSLPLDIVHLQWLLSSRTYLRPQNSFRPGVARATARTSAAKQIQQSADGSGSGGPESAERPCRQLFIPACRGVCGNGAYTRCRSFGRSLRGTLAGLRRGRLRPARLKRAARYNGNRSKNLCSALSAASIPAIVPCVLLRATATKRREPWRTSARTGTRSRPRRLLPTRPEWAI